MRRSSALLVASLLSSTACGGGTSVEPDAAIPDASTALGGPVVVDLAAEPPTLLSAYRLFLWDPVTGFAFNDRVVPYDLNTALFSDYALKQRAVYVPPGTSATFDQEEAFQLPIGSAVVKSFFFADDLRAPTVNRRIIETRVMVRHSDGWHPLPYIWKADQSDAVLTPAGEVRPISFIGTDGTPEVSTYLVPERNQCTACHLQLKPPAAPEVVLIGLKARHVNRDHDYGPGIGVKNQLDYLGQIGMLAGAPTADTVAAAFDFRPIEANGSAALTPGDIEIAARAYLDINCAHCHSPNGVSGDTSQLFLNRANNDPFHLGVCKRPGSAGTGTGGFVFDIVPGSPDTSILYFRDHTEQVGAMMPLLGRSITHARGSELLHAWIAQMPADDCMATQ